VCQVFIWYHYLSSLLRPVTQRTTPTVWIVDDDEDDQLLIRAAFLEGEPSVKVLMLHDGDELLPKLSQSDQLPRLVLLDVNMPRKNGFDTLSELRQLPDFADLPVVMLTTSSANEDRQRSLALGANHFLIKPLSYEQLKELAQKLSREWELS
jgi:CheY-like chemotaxis protein